MSALSIPTVDLDDLRGDDEARARAAAAIREGFGAFGLVYVRNHGIDPALLDRYYDVFTQLTSRAEADKRRLARPDLWYQRGWTPPNTEQAVAAGGQPDFKECYFASPTAIDAELQAQYPEIYAENVWPTDIAGFEETYLALGAALHRAGSALLTGAAVALSLEADRFTRLIEGGPHITRALRYIPLNEAQVGGGILWGEEHTDFNLLTLLPGGRFIDPSGARCPPPDPESGLYLRTRATAADPAGRKVRGAAPAGCIVAQVGQQLEIVTGGTFLATPHVITAPKAPGYSRLSCAHFVHAHPHATLFPFTEFRNPETVRAYSPPVLAGTYDLKTLVDIALAPKTALDLLGYRHYDRLNHQRTVG
ncbi:MAG: isopenicillin N synthase family oxygenase [Myxococcales bacterium]|nr:isopenicillin N synthase family oxygenase [Myxococcales bacterium]